MRARSQLSGGISTSLRCWGRRFRQRVRLQPALRVFWGRRGRRNRRPGCNSLTGGIDQAFQDDGAPAVGFGTSQAAAIASTILAALRAYSPYLSVAQAEACITSSERDGGNIDAAGAFAACGLESVVQAGLAALPPPKPADQAGPTPSPSSAAVPSEDLTTGAVRPLPRPLIRVLRGRGRLTVVARNRPKGASVAVRVLSWRGHQLSVVASRVLRASRVVLKVRRAHIVKARFVLSARASPWISTVADWLGLPAGGSPAAWPARSHVPLSAGRGWNVPGRSLLGRARVAQITLGPRSTATRHTCAWMPIALSPAAP